jgi:NAD(P)-dependent dehydrogenase (short-subunit alcohol dehydrogenase family)
LHGSRKVAAFPWFTNGFSGMDPPAACCRDPPKLRDVPSVLVTGASRGIGRAVATTLARSGWEVWAGVRRSEDVAALRAAVPSGQLRPIQLDVRDPDQVAGLPDVLDGHLDAVVNNAGIVVAGPIEALDLGELRDQLDVNVVAQVAVTQAVLPLLRSSRGRVVFVGSVSGRVSTPFMGAYTASKFALEAVADSLRMELRPWRMPVVLVEPGSTDTDLWRNALDVSDAAEAKMTSEHRRLYARQLVGMRKAVAMVQKRTSPVEKVAGAVEHALTAARPRPRYLVGGDARAQVALRAALPTRVLDALITRATTG